MKSNGWTIESPILCITFLSCLVLAVFLPTLWNEVCLIDDVSLLQLLAVYREQATPFALLFHQDNTVYYRPIIFLNYWLDAHLLAANPILLHLENIILHLANTLLVFFIGYRVQKLTWGVPGLALFSATLFSIHPIVTESINWICGRSDLLAGFFVLLCVYSLLAFLSKGRKLWLVSAIVCFVLAVITKELAFGLAPGLVLLALSRDLPSRATLSGRCHPLLRRGWVALGLFAGGFGLVAGVVLFRSLVLTVSDSGIAKTVRYILLDIPHAIALCLRSFGFYLKKLVLPLPLNFAIVDADPLYDLLAVPLIVLSLYVISRMTIRSALFTAGLGCMIPSFLVAFHQFAWTPFAERYVYVTAALMVFPVSSVVYRALKKHTSSRSAKFVGGAVLLIFLTLTVIRNNEWRTNRTLFDSTVKNSPDAMVPVMYRAYLLLQNDELDEAMFEFKRSLNFPGLLFDSRPYVGIAEVHRKRGEWEAGRQAYMTGLKQSMGLPFASVKIMADFLFFLDAWPEGHSVKRDEIYRQTLLRFDELDRERDLEVYRFGSAVLNLWLGNVKVGREELLDLNDETDNDELKGLITLFLREKQSLK